MPVAQDFDKEVQDLKTRVTCLEHKQSRMCEAFVKNDLSIEDYDGHRRDHSTRIEEDKVITGYKRLITGKGLWVASAALAVLFGQAIIEWLRAHLK